MPRAAVTLCGRLRCGAVYHSNWFNYVGVGRGRRDSSRQATILWPYKRDCYIPGQSADLFAAKGVNGPLIVETRR